MDHAALTFYVRGPFCVEDETGESLCLTISKAKALLALLAFAPRHTRSRQWLVDKLWSDRPHTQARSSLRQTLKVLRQALGPRHAAYLTATRSAVSLTCAVRLDALEGTAFNGEVLEDLDVKDPEFDDWLRDIRQAHDHPVPKRVADEGSVTPAVLRDSRVANIGLSLVGGDISGDALLISEALLDLVATLLDASDAVACYRLHTASSLPAPDTFCAHVELGSTVQGEEWFAHVRVTPANRQHYAWSGRLRLPVRMSEIWDSAELSAFANQIHAGILKTVQSTSPEAHLVALNRASGLLFSSDADRVDTAQALLDRLVSESGSAAALAWRAFVVLTRAVEFGTAGESDAAMAREMMAEALSKGPQSALVNGLASILHFKMFEDYDYGYHLAELGVAADERNPYALDALSQALFFRGEHERAYQVSEWARSAARHAQNAFNWDMRAALCALSLDRQEEARALAMASHIKAPRYRPALRYLYALNALSGDHAAALRFGAKLAQQEPDFGAQKLLEPDYPVHTLRWLGLNEDAARHM